MKAESIINVEEIGIEETIDLEVDSLDHIYYANNICSHNSHAVCYAIDSYQSAYCKAHFPLQFYCAYLQGAKNKINPHEEIFELVVDAKQYGLEIKVPDFRSVQNNIHIVDNNCLRFGISNIKGVGDAAIKKISSIKSTYSQSEIENWQWMDYLLQFSDNISSSVNEALISVGSFDYFKSSRNLLLFELNIWNKLTDKEKDYIKNNGKKYSKLEEALLDCSLNGCRINKRKEVVSSLISSLKNPPHLLSDTPDWLSWIEKKYIGAALSCSKIDGCSSSISATCTCKEVNDGKKGYLVIAVEIFAAREIVTKNGDKMAFLVVSDGTTALENIICFPQQWVEMKAILYPNNTALLQIEQARGRKGYIIKQCFQI